MIYDNKKPNYAFKVYDEDQFNIIVRVGMIIVMDRFYNE